MLARFSLPSFSGKRRFDTLSETEILALAISSEEEDGRIYAIYAQQLRAAYPASAAIFDGMAREEDGHRQRLLALHRQRFGDVVLPIRREHVADFYARKPVWLVENLGLDQIRAEAEDMERQARDFYVAAAGRSTDVDTRALLGELAAAEAGHEAKAQALTAEHLDSETRSQEDLAAKRQFVLTWVQPGLAGLMDGSVSTLAPIFATAFATQDPRTTFLIGLSASIGAGISMGFAEAVSDNGSLTGRGAPWMRGAICGVMTTLGGVGHTLPYLIHDFLTATILAVLVVFVELGIITWIRWRYMDTPPWSAAMQVGFGGALVFATGILIGSA